MVEDIRDQADLELSDFQKFVNDCRQSCAALSGDIGDSNQLLDAIEQRSQSFHEKALQRIGGLHELIEEIRAEYRQQAESIESESRQSGQQARDAAEAYHEQVADMSARLADLRGRIEAAANTVEGGVEALTQRTRSLNEARLQLVQRVNERKRITEEITYTGLNAGADDLTHTLELEAVRFEESFRDGFDRVLVSGTQEYLGNNQETVDRFMDSIHTMNAEFRQSVDLILQQFAQSQTEQIQKLQHETGDTLQAVQHSVEAFDTHADEFVSFSDTANEAMRETQIGLKVTAGSLEKVIHILEEIRP